MPYINLSPDEIDTLLWRRALAFASAIERKDWKAAQHHYTSLDPLLHSLSQGLSQSESDPRDTPPPPSS